jgi:hypothetical protein
VMSAIISGRRLNFSYLNERESAFQSADRSYIVAMELGLGFQARVPQTCRALTAPLIRCRTHLLFNSAN